MAKQPKKQPTFTISSVGNLNTGDVNIKGDQIGIQQNCNTSPELQRATTDLQTALNELKVQNPTVMNEAQALKIIDAEFAEIQQSNISKFSVLRQQLLNPERHFQASKATIVEVLKHFLEESLWAKAFITYLDTMSSTPEKGA